METAAPPLYRHLDPSTSEIRLLEIPSDGSEDWRLITISLDDDPEYAALSYVWGEKKDLKKIVLQGQDKEVTPNLAAALSRIRSGNLGETSAPIKYLWADAICINQEDNEERSQQVQLMCRIFSCAQTVCSWVGPEDYSLAFQTIKTLAHEVVQNWPNNTILDDDDDLVSKQQMMMQVPPFEIEWLQRHTSLCDKDDAWNAVVELLSHQYWKRVWIFQETVLARQLHLVGSGGITLSWRDLFVATESFFKLDLEHKATGDEMQKPDFLSRKVWTDLIWYQNWSTIHKVFLAKLNTKLGTRWTTWRSDIMDWGMVTFSQRLVATDPKDYIYGLLAISQIPISPDYSKSVVEVYTDFVEAWIETSKKPGVENFSPLGFLALAGVGGTRPADNFPNWAPNFAEPRPSKWMSTIILGETFRGDPSKHPYLVRNTGSLVAWGARIEPVYNFLFIKVEPTTSLADMHLNIFYIGLFVRSYTYRYSHYVSGIASWQAITRLLFEEKPVTVTRDMVNFLLLLADVLSKLGKIHYPDHFGGWDSLDSSLFPNGWETRLYRLAFPGTDLTQLGFSDNPLSDIRSWEKADMDENMILCTKKFMGHSLFETAGGYLGIGPPNVQEDDVLCVLKDYDHPVLLREQEGFSTFVGDVASVVDLDLEKSAQDSPSGLKWLEMR